jgi:hypothetical protein
VLAIHFETPSRQNDCARREPLCAPVRPASVALRRHLASSMPAAHHSRKWLDGVSDALAYALRRLRDLSAPAPTPAIRAHRRLPATTRLRFALQWRAAMAVSPLPARLGPPSSTQPDTYRTLFALLPCIGLRIAEAIALRLQDWTADGPVGDTQIQTPAPPSTSGRAIPFASVRQRPDLTLIGQRSHALQAGPGPARLTPLPLRWETLRCLLDG